MKNLSIIGHLGGPVSVYYTANSTRIGSFSVAVSERKFNKETGEKEQKTDWFKVVLFGSMVDLAEKFLDKGSKVYVHGQFKINKWTDKQGVLQTTVEILANQLEFLNKIDKAEDAAPSNTYADGSPKSTYAENKTRHDHSKDENEPDQYDDNDIPF